MDCIFRRTGSFFFALFVALLGLSGCENPGSIDGTIGGPGAEVTIDTLAINSITSRSVNFYSGSFSHFSAGAYDDPLLGNLRATGLIKPGLPIASADTLTDNSKMLMRILLDGSQVYGDSLADQTFDVYEISELWRGKAIKLKDELQLDKANGPLTSFTMGEEDSVDVELPSEWIQEYREYASANADSLYRVEQSGFAIVPTNSNKILALNSSSTRFVVQNPQADTFNVTSNQWGYLLERNNAGPLPEGSIAWHSTHESILNLNIDLAQIEVPPSGISNTKLVLYQNNDLMENSLDSESSSVDRAKETTAQLYMVDPDQLPDNITRAQPVANGFYSEDDGAFHFDVTSLMQNLLTNGMQEGQELIMTLTNNGVIKSSVIYTENASFDKRPKLIITSLKNSSN